jgi:hypothetical protein
MMHKYSYLDWIDYSKYDKDIYKIHGECCAILI